MLVCESHRAQVGSELAPAFSLELRDGGVLCTFTCAYVQQLGIVRSSQLSSSCMAGGTDRPLPASIMSQITTLTTAHLQLISRGRTTAWFNTLAFSLMDENYLCFFAYPGRNQTSKDAFNGVA